MSQDILFVGLEVDDQAYHLCGLNERTGEALESQCVAEISKLRRCLQRLAKHGTLKICYEATYVGFWLCRQIRCWEYDCEIIAPSATPRKAGERVKTDRVDARKLALYYSKGLLTKIHVPDEMEETERSLVRGRHFHAQELRRFKAHLVFLGRRHGLRWGPGKSLWTGVHRKFLKEAFQTTSFPALRFHGQQLLRSIDFLEQQVAFYDQELAALAQTASYQPAFQALTCFRGLQTVTAMTLITEIGDIRRFSHPRPLMGFAGLGVREYSSGKKERRFGITKTGNPRLRWVLIEACQYAWKPPQISRRLQIDRTDVKPEVVAVADRAMDRLYRKSTRMLRRGKSRNLVKTACARELLGFVWESMNKAAA